jgi:hypothetical protein
MLCMVGSINGRESVTVSRTLADLAGSEEIQPPASAGGIAILPEVVDIVRQGESIHSRLRVRFDQSSDHHKIQCLDGYSVL